MLTVIVLARLVDGRDDRIAIDSTRIAQVIVLARLVDGRD